MKRRFSEEQIIGILKQQEAGQTVAAVCREHGVGENTFYTCYTWKRKFGGMTVSEARRLRQLEEENTRLKKLLAESGALWADWTTLLSRMCCQKNGEARRAARGRATPSGRAWLLAAAGLPPGAREQGQHPLPQQARQ